MPSRIDPMQPTEGTPASKAMQRANWAAAKAELEHGGFFVQAGVGAVERTAQEKLRELAVSVKDFGARGDGVADDTPAIRAALQHVGEQGGGTVFLPPGVYKIMPQASGEHAVSVSWSNVALVGAGMGVTRLVFRCLGGADPATGYEVIEGAVWRGHGIAVTSPAPEFDPAVPIRNLVFRDFDLDGGIADANQGMIWWPADPATGDGWDLTHKGITLPENAAFEDALFERVHVHHWRGEILYRAGGSDGRRVTIRECRVGETNANGINFSCADRHLSDTEIYNCYGAACEDVLTGDATFHRMRVRGCGHGLLVGTLLGVKAQITVSDCLLYDCPRSGITCFSGNTTITGNTLVDCGSQHSDGRAIWVGTMVPNVIQWEPERRGVIVAGNVIKAYRKRCEIGILIGGNDASPAKDVLITGNVLVRDPENTEDFLFGFLFNLEGSGNSEIVLRGNLLDTNSGSGASYIGQYWATSHVPLIAQDNIFRPRFVHSTQRPKVMSEGTEPLRWPEVEFDNQVGAGATPAIDASLYERGYRVKIVGGLPPVAIGARAAGWCLQADRTLEPGTELTAEFDGERFCEVHWIDKR